jgi:cytochrome d ubiquinol oxidase subunit II
MTHEIYGIIWYNLLTILWVGFIVFESFTSGVGMILKTARNEKEGRLLQYTVGPYWDGSQVWFITAGGATFAAFPVVYADIFSNLYVALYLLLVMLITRGISMELVYKDENPKWQQGMAWAWVISSYGLALLLGVRFTNLFLKANTLPVSVNDFWGLLSKPGILGGLLFIALYRTSGILWANLTAKGEAAAVFMPILMLAFNWDSNLFTTNFQELPLLWILPILAMLLPVATILALLKDWYQTAFWTNIASMALFMIIGFVGVFPYMAPGITFADGMASHLTLRIMTLVVLIFLPVVLFYQGWKFWKFREKHDISYFD